MSLSQAKSTDLRLSTLVAAMDIPTAPRVAAAEFLAVLRSTHADDWYESLRVRLGGSKHVARDWFQ